MGNGDVDFRTEQVKQKCSTETGKDARSVEDIGPQEEGESAVCYQRNKFLFIDYKLIHFLFNKLCGFIGVRRRIKSKKDITDKDASKEASNEKAPEITPQRKSDQNPQQDPLKWFGILVPQSLKQAKSSFKQGMI